MGEATPAGFGAILPVRAELTGSDTATALDLTARGRTPVLSLCRMLVDAGHDPALQMHVYRGTTLCLKVRSIGEAAKLSVRETGSRPRLVPFEEFSGRRAEAAE